MPFIIPLTAVIPEPKRPLFKTFIIGVPLITVPSIATVFFIDDATLKICLYPTANGPLLVVTTCLLDFSADSIWDIAGSPVLISVKLASIIISASIFCIASGMLDTLSVSKL